MNLLSRLEEILLIAIFKLKENAYGITIREQVELDTDINWLSGAIYAPLNRLKKNGFVTITEVKVSDDKVGRPRVYYSITSRGMDKLTSIQNINNKVWNTIPDLNQAKL